jgi:hypothetical protein
VICCASMIFKRFNWILIVMTILQEPVSPRSPNGFYYPPANQQQQPPQPIQQQQQSHQHYHHQSMNNGSGASSHYSHHQFGPNPHSNYGQPLPPPPHLQSPMFGNGYTNGNHHQPHYSSGNYSHRNHGFGKHTYIILT